MKRGIIGNREKAIIHIAKQQLGLTEEEYRRQLKAVGVTSSKQLGWVSYNELILRFQAQGFVLRTGKRKKFVAPPPAGLDRQKLLKKAAAILGDIGKGWYYADAIAKHMFKVDACRWLRPEQLHAVVAALEYKRNQVLGTGPEKSFKRTVKKV